ncbi:thiamine pyrophosphate-dependent dehydrogenase E1 component subunit alpha [Rhodopseudomonas palustris]|uniref:thiamine pyrophosphate-dependent dehydrogenase E1 component subunit alpha n=1 Tax=Rhodopseudomonas palustris TaxID=1076 RepID=UPI000641C10E|nr:thiamine pyrophosphate-dependent dehydrogenase E1 component subunit alpha [Rhodopseudomonas palustris]
MNPETSRRLLFDMLRIRSVEETIAARYGEQKMRCPTHLSVGQEAVAAAAGAVLRPTDLAVSGHRAHAHYLAKGGSLKAMIAEIYGKVTGCARGKGGSMHLIDESVGFMGSTAIVGGTVPVGIGLSYPMKLNKTGQISCVFLGDAVPETGVFFESVNFAMVKQLPVLFLCENNGYSVYSPLSVRQPPGRKLHELVAGFGLVTHHGDGNDARAVVAALSEGVAAIRSGEGPRFYEFETYRWREHCGPNYDNEIGYRSVAEFEAWKLRDPVPALQRALITEAIVTDADVADMQAEIDAEIEEAFAFAESSPFPPPEDAFTDVYASTAG